MSANPVPDEISRLERPHPNLWKYYIIASLCTGPGALVSLPYLYFRYHTLRYRFDDEGIHMKVGVLFRREVNLTYARIQDIHLRSNIVQRWLGLGNVQIQTASGSSGPELVIEGFKEFEAIRDFLYTRMRGYQAGPAVSSGPVAKPQTASASGASAMQGSGGQDEAVALLLAIRDELKRTRELLESAKSTPGSSPAATAPGTASTAAAPPKAQWWKG